MDSKLVTRIKELEKRLGYSDVIGIREAGSKVVKISGSGEELLYDEFFEKYPKATCITVEYADSPPDITIKVTYDTPLEPDDVL